MPRSAVQRSRRAAAPPVGGRVLAAVAVTLVLWASAFVAIRVALPGLGAAGLSVGRLLVASAALALAAPVLGARRPARAELPRILACGATGMTAYQLLLNVGERSVPAGTASLLVSTGPIFAAVLAFAVLGEPLTRRGWTGVALGFTGATVMALSHVGGVRPGGGAMLVLGAAVAQAAFFVLQKPLLARYSGFEVTCWATWAGAVLSLPLVPALVRALPAADGPSLAALLLLGVGPSAIGFVMWAYAQARLPVATAANSLYLVPLLAVGIGWLALGETVGPGAVVGGLVAVVGVAVQRGRARPAVHPEAATSDDALVGDLLPDDARPDGSAGLSDPSDRLRLMATTEAPRLVVSDVDAWRTWLAAHVDDEVGVWLVLAKKGTTEPTSLTYAQALEEALCHGWIDGQVRGGDGATYVQRFTRRRARSLWSQRNVGLVERLTDEGRMHPNGLAEVARAQGDGRWDAAYAGSATIEVPADLAEALAANPLAQKAFDALNRRDRYSVLHPVVTARRADTRARRIATTVDTLAGGGTTDPQGAGTT